MNRLLDALPRPLRNLIGFARDFLLALGEHAVYSHAAALAFFIVFSVPPALLGMVSLAGMLPVEALVYIGLDHVDDVLQWTLERFLDPQAAAAAADSALIAWSPITDTLLDLDRAGMVGRLGGLLEGRVPEAVAATVVGFVEDVLEEAHPGLLTVGFIGVLWSASGVTRQLLRAVNAIHEIRPRPWWRMSLVSIGMTLSLLAVGTLFFILMPLAGVLVEALATAGLWLVVWRLVVGAGALLLLYAVMQRLYDWAVWAKIPPRHRREGVVLTLALWTLLVWVAGRFGQDGLERYSATYGALTSVVFLLFWVYAMAISLLLGVEWNATRLSQGPWWEAILGDRARRYTRRAAERDAFGFVRSPRRPLDSGASAPRKESEPDS